MSFSEDRRGSLGLTKESERNRRPSSSVYVEHSYEVGEKLGEGAFGTVYAGKAKVDGSPVAIKVISKERPSAAVDPAVFAAHLEQVRNEIAALEELSGDEECDCIITFRGAFETKDKLSIVMDMAHGELADVIAKGSVTVTEKDVQKILKRVLTGVAFMHEHDYVHRDLKFENLLMMEKANFDSIVLTDFGLATKTNEAGPGECGTPLYMSPEIWMRNSVAHGPKVDIWAVGIIAYILLCGQHPIKAKNLDELKARVCVDRIHLDFGNKGISSTAQDFVRRLLTSDPISRPAAKDALAHPFITGDTENQVQDSVVDMLRAYAAELRLKKGMHVVDAVTRMQILQRQSGSDRASSDHTVEDSAKILHRRISAPKGAA